MNRKVKNHYDMIKIDNKLFEQLNTEEFYLYCWLRYRYVAYELNCTTASIDLMANRIQFVKDMTRNKQKIKDILLKLQHSKIITIKHDSKIKNNTTLEIAFNNMNPLTEYTALDYKYVHVGNHQELYVIATLRRWQHAKDKTFSLSKWADILSISVPTVLEVFERMKENGLIYVESGDYYNNEKGELRQENNRYYLCDGQAKTEDESVVTKMVTTETATRGKVTRGGPEQVVSEREPPGVDGDGLIFGKYTDKRLLERDNLIRSGAGLKDADFDIYVTTDDEKLIKDADTRFKHQISVNDKGEKFVKDMIAKAKRRLEQKEAHRKQQEEWISSMPPPDQVDYTDNQEYVEHDWPGRVDWKYNPR